MTKELSKECSSKEFTTGTCRPKPFTRWWLKSRPTTLGIQLNDDGTPPCIEFYVPWWAWPLELLHMVVFGSTKITTIK